MRHFILKTFLFISPLIFLLMVPIAVLILSKEALYIDRTIINQKKYLIGFAYMQQDFRYMKWLSITYQGNNVIMALGSSRVLQFQKQMFDSTFFNAGKAISGLNDCKSFLQSIPKPKYPKYLIIGLDQWMFNEACDSLKYTPSKESWGIRGSIYPTISICREIYKDIFSGKYNFRLFFKSDSIYKVGLNALVHNMGFLNDGSYYYGDLIVKLLKNDSTYSDFEYRDTYDRIRKGNDIFESGNSVNDKAITVLNDFLQYCKENKIQVVAFLPPFADNVYKRLILNGNYGYLKEIYPKTKTVFEKYNYELYDFSSVSACNSSDSETIDGIHGGSLTYQRLLIQMLDSGSILNKVTNATRLKIDLKNCKNRYKVYKN